jgi:hypothetical protein
MAGFARLPNEPRDHGRAIRGEASFGKAPNERFGWAGNGRRAESERLFGGNEGTIGAKGEGLARSGNWRRFDRAYGGPRYGHADLGPRRSPWLGDYGPGRQWMRFRDARDFTGDFRPAWSPLIEGCPPGLAKHGCIPPGQARAIWGYAEPYENWYTYPAWYRYDNRYDWRYYGGYLYRVDPATLLIGAFLPLLGGALYAGNLWPAHYDDYVVDPYYVRYYGYEPADFDYRYADGAIFAVDRGSHRIHTVVALVTGDHWAVGEPMPYGYDFYNVPPEYRDRYYDRDDAWYRYSDGYIYEIDPRTLVVRSSIELLAT